MHYLDNASTTRVTRSAANAALDAMLNRFGNPSSVHSLGIEAEGIISRARKELADALGCKPQEIYFTSGGTEADNLAVIQGAELQKRKGRHIITTSIEHPAVINAMKYLASNGFEVTFLSPEKDGTVSLEAFEQSVRRDTVLVSMMLCNNETGAFQPVAEAVRLFREKNPDGLFHTDAVQAFMKQRFDVRSLGVDLLSVSSHKIHGPKGAGALYVRGGVKMKPLLHGGNQESGLRSGTEAVPAIAGFGEAVREARADLQNNMEKIDRLRGRLIAGLVRLPKVELIAAGSAIITLAVPKYPTEVIIRLLESRNIFVSGGSACSRGKSSHVLEAMKVQPNLIKSSVRVSLSWHNTDEDIDALLLALEEIA